MVLEKKIEDDIRKLLESHGWSVYKMHGNAYQSGIPDLYAIRKSGKGVPPLTRWIEVKKPNMKGSKFTKAQKIVFPEWTAQGVGIWIMTAATDIEYKKLFKPANWTRYLRIMR